MKKKKKAKGPKRNGPAPIKIDASRVEAIAALGGTNEQIAAGLGISEGTLFNLRKRDAKVDAAIQTGKDKADLKVVASLFRRAVGEFLCPHCKKRIEVSTDTTAMIFWLKNRRPKEWKDRHEVDNTFRPKMSLPALRRSLDRLKADDTKEQ